MKYILFLLTFMLVSCAEKPETTLKVSVGAIGANTNFHGGLVLLGKSNNGFRVSKVVPLGDSAEIYLPNGTWDFSVIGWDNNISKIMEGDSYCAFQQGVSLNGADVILNLNATAANCINPIFGGNIENTDQFQKVEFNSCTGIKYYFEHEGLGIIPPGMTCDGGNTPLPGEFKSFKVIIPEVIAGNNQIFTAGGLNSACQSNDTTSFGSNLRLPKGTRQVPMPYIIKAYSNTTCNDGTGYNKDYIFKNGLSGLIPNFEAGAKYDSSINATKVFLNSTPCNPDMLAAQGGADFPIMTVSAGRDSYLICSADDFANIATGGNDLNGIYHLGANIDFAPAGNSTITTFNGQLRGNGFTLSNGTNPLIGTVNAQAATEVRIEGLKLNNFTITASTNVGVLINDVVGSASTQRIDIERNEITNSSIANSTAAMHIGGLIGSIGMGASTNYAFIRENKVQVDITGSNDNQKIGGLVGNANGGSATIAFEGNYVGVNNINDTSDRTAAITITSTAANASGFTNTAVGGLVGYTTETEVRDYNFVIADINGVENVGGLVGAADANTRIKNSFANLVFAAQASCANSTSGACAKVGGIVGYIPAITSGEEVEINGTVSSLKINTSSDEIDYVGGILGDYYSTSTVNEIRIRDARAYTDVATYGFAHGGVIGSFYAVNGAPSNPVIERVYAQGALMLGSTGTTADEKGGFVGNVNNLVTKMSVVDIEIEGYQYLGGAYGWADGADTQVVESYVQSDITTKHTADNDYIVGGVFGQIEAAPTLFAVVDSKIITDIRVTGVGTEPSNASSLGLTYGRLNTTQGSMIDEFETSIFKGQMYYDSINTPFSGDVYNNFTCGNSTDTTAACGAATLVSSNFIYFNDNSTTCNALEISLSKPFDYEAVAGRYCVPLFESQWRKFGLVTDGSFEFYKAGSKLEPLPLSNYQDWNGIGTDIFLLSKTYEFTQDISFDGQTFNPIGYDGTNVAAFTGQILTGSYKLRDINYTTGGSPAYIGIIAGTNKDARIGERGQPFKVQDITLTCNSDNCGFIGMAGSSRLYVDAQNITVNTGTSTLNCIGGLIGVIDEPGNTGAGVMIEVEDTRFFGSLITGVGTGAQGVGGISGCMWSGINTIGIKNTAMILKRLEGSNKVGGFVGYPNSDDNVNVEESYIRFLGDNDAVTTDIDVDDTVMAGPNPASALGGVIGQFEASLTLSNFYMDYSLATFNDTATNKGFHEVGSDFQNAGGDVSYTNTFIVRPATAAVNGVMFNGTVTTGTLQNSVGQTNFSNSTFLNNTDKFIYHNGSVKLDWEVNGFNN